MTNRPPRTQRQHTCLTCGARLECKRLGRPARYCSDRCRDKAYEGRNFSVFAAARIRGKAIRRNSQETEDCEDDFAGRGSVFLVPLDLMGHASFKFDSLPLDADVVAAILKTELPVSGPKDQRGE
jgi:hypothetical protein